MQTLDPDLTTNMPKQLPKDFFIPDADYDATVNAGDDPAQGANFGGDSVDVAARDTKAKEDAAREKTEKAEAAREKKEKLEAAVKDELAARGVNDINSGDRNAPARGVNPDEKDEFKPPPRGVDRGDDKQLKGIQYEEEGMPPGWVRQWDAK